MIGCWYCHAVACDSCPHCGSTRAGRAADRAFYASFRPVDRAAEKRAARDEDARRLAAGEVTREQLTKENSLLPPGTEVRITHHGGPAPKRRKRT